MYLTESQKKWSNIIAEEMGVKDDARSKKNTWMSMYAQIHDINSQRKGGLMVEGLQDPSFGGANIYSTPLNTLGMGNPMAPQAVQYAQGTGIGNTGADFHNPNYQLGSGDIPMSTLTMALEIAAVTIGFELVPVVPASGPWAMLSYMDTPYAGGKLGRLNETAFDGTGTGDDNKPIYIKLNANLLYETGKSKADLVKGTTQIVFATAANGAELRAFLGTYMGFSRIDNGIIVKVESTGIYTVDGDPKIITYTAGSTLSIADVFATNLSYAVSGTLVAANFTADGILDEAAIATPYQVTPDLVANFADHIQGFSNFVDGDADPMTRAENETGVGNAIGVRLFSKWVQMGSYEVTGGVTRQQLQDMPLYGVDVIGSVLESMQNQISQEINNRILDRVFRLGVENAKIQKAFQGVDYNLYMSATPGAVALSTFPSASNYVDIHGVNVAASWGNVANSVDNTNFENVTTRQRRIMSRMLASANLIANVSRRGRGTWAVMGFEMLSALQDAANYALNPMSNTLTQDGSQSLYFAGSVAGLNLYVDPYMNANDTRICIGRKAEMTGNNKISGTGVVFMPYILADTVQTVVEGTMAPKLLCNSRFAIVDAGFHPEQNYYTFMVHSTEGVI